MSRGKWYFVFTYDDPSAGIKSGLSTREISLEATTEDEAVSEAGARLSDINEKAEAYWKIQKETCRHPPLTAFESGPFNPCVVYKIWLR